eukprot:COSAG02_NODE_64600_length_260_cov_0.639752_1_plen_35_part_01
MATRHWPTGSRYPLRPLSLALPHRQSCDGYRQYVP